MRPSCRYRGGSWKSLSPECLVADPSKKSRSRRSDQFGVRPALPRPRVRSSAASTAIRPAITKLQSPTRAEQSPMTAPKTLTTTTNASRIAAAVTTTSRSSTTRTATLADPRGNNSSRRSATRFDAVSGGRARERAAAMSRCSCIPSLQWSSDLIVAQTASIRGPDRQARALVPWVLQRVDDESTSGKDDSRTCVAGAVQDLRASTSAAARILGT
jgi:hypothetical protein